MALASTLYRFQIELSDVDKGVYKSLDLRLAMHPSESPAYLLTRLLAMALNDQEYLAFSPGGLSDPEAPALSAVTPNGEIRLWIEIGNPSARKLHKASKAARQVKVYTYKDAEILLKEIRNEKVHRSDRIEVHSIAAKFLESLAGRLERKNSWGIIHQEGTVTVSIGDFSESAEIIPHPVEP